MKKVLYFIGVFLFLLACTKRDKSENYVDITISSWNHTINDRNGEDYVKLWVNDTLLFSDTFYVGYIDSLPETWYNIAMKAASICKTNRDSVKIRIRLIALDSVLFAGQYAVDTTFRYRIDNIPYMNIDYYRELNYFRIMDPVKDPNAFLFD